MSIQGIGSYTGHMPTSSALESAREGVSRSTEMMTNAAQAVAGVIVELSSDSPSVVASATSLSDGVLDAQVAEYMALANMRVATVAGSLSDELLAVLDNTE